MKKHVSDKELHLDATSKTFRNAIRLRQELTDAEFLLWNCLRNRNLNGFKFRRQHPLGRFIADFYCHEAKLAIEIDGSIHDLIKNAEYDEGRSIELAENEIRILRFSNSDVYFCLDLVLEKISNTLTGKM